MHVAAAFLLLFVCSFGGISPVHAATKSYGLTSFDSIDVQGPYQVSITLGQRINARAEGAQTALDKVEMEVVSNRLVIRERRDGAAQVRRDGAGPVRIFVNASKALNMISISGAGSVAVSGLSGTTLKLSLTGSGQIAATVAKADKIELLVDGSGSVSLTGVARALSSGTSGSGTIDAAALGVRQLVLRQSGAGNGRYNVSEFATITASGTGNVSISGKGLCRIKQDGGTNIQCAGKILPAK